MGSLLIFSWLWSKKGLPCGCQIVRRRKQRSRAPPCSLRPYARPCICPCARFSSFSEIEGKHMCACIFQSCGDATRLHTRSVCLLVKSLGLFEHGFKPDFPPPHAHKRCMLSSLTCSCPQLQLQLHRSWSVSGWRGAESSTSAATRAW